MRNRYNVWVRCTEPEYQGQWRSVLSGQSLQYCNGYANAIRMLTRHTVAVSKQRIDFPVEDQYQRKLQRIRKAK